ncbi:phage tail tip lysozyme [Streptococcus pyogenes]|uniref:phage tail tip lysozyme n=1 Tax=Streptococcus pyogenes TaxID=1314 RepID=UPI0010A1CB59|nr:phage tail tip lysozyme [Streptococcus pyogenes]VGV41656.1 Surface antigen [Streptococcus pyogenes]VGV60657.1 Surface antigen [Streptococcus pyogenes]VGW10775.1 Surface antigen [Streptococcus pyogenes]VHC07706.1 Surface antigen [Streptococcus pyogenes]VHC60253.1 Surface antigen [Streptococcus pyogenes]
MKKWILSTLLLPLFLPLLLIILAGAAIAGDATSSSSSGTTTGSHTTLTAQEVAQKASISEERAADVIKILNYQLSVENFTLAGSTGSLAVAERESGFDPKAVNTSGGVAGYFQWSGWSSTINGNRWGQAESKTLDGDVELKLMSAELGGSYKTVKEEMQKATDAKDAALYWSEHYEGVALSDGQTKAEELKADAKKWYDIFDGTIETTSTSTDFSGETGLTAGTILSSFTFPTEYNGKLKYGVPTANTMTTLGNNTYPAGQCTWYVCNRLIETGICTNSAIYNYNGNGQDWVTSLVSRGWKQVSTPQVGAVMSVQGGYGGTMAEYGHVAFVEAVNQDGTFLISECNVSGVQNTPHYAVLSNQSYYSFAVAQ